MAGDRETGLAAGVTDYTSQPLDSPKFVEFLSGLLRKGTKPGRDFVAILSVPKSHRREFGHFDWSQVSQHDRL